MSSKLDWDLESQGDTVTTFPLEERGPVEIEGTDGITYTGHRAVGTYDQEGGRRRTWLYVFEKDGELVKYRATTPEADVEVVAPRVEAFIAGTLGELDAEDAAVEPEGLLWEQEYAPARQRHGAELSTHPRRYPGPGGVGGHGRSTRSPARGHGGAGRSRRESRSSRRPRTHAYVALRSLGVTEPPHLSETQEGHPR